MLYLPYVFVFHSHSEKKIPALYLLKASVLKWAGWRGVFLFLACIGLWPAVSAQEWTGATSSNWDTAANWSPATVPFNTFALFELSAANRTISVGTETISGMRFNDVVSYTLNGGSLTLGNFPTIQLSGGTVTDTINSAIILTADLSITATSVGNVALNLAGTFTANNHSLSYSGGFGTGTVTLAGNFSGTGNITMTNSTGVMVLSGTNTHSGGTILNGGVLKLQSASPVGTGLLNLNSGSLDNTTGATLTLPNNTQQWSIFTFLGSNDLNLGNGAIALTNTNSAVTINAGTLTADGVISGVSKNLTKAGAGNLVLGGASTYNGTTTVTGGTLQLNFSSASAPASNILASASNLTLSAGTTLLVTGKAGATNTQTFNSTTLSGGNSKITTAQNGATSLTLSLGALNRAAGATADLTLPTTGSVTTSTSTLTGNVLVSGSSAYMTVNGVDWATVASGSIVATTYDGTSDIATWPGVNVALATDPSGPVSSLSLNTLKLSGSSAVTIASANTITVAAGGILLTGTGSNSINGGQLMGPASGGLTIIQNNTTNPLVVGSSIIDNGSATPLVKSGPGVLRLDGANTFSGNTTVNAGTLLLNNSLALQNSLVTVAAGAALAYGAPSDYTIGGLSGAAGFALPTGTLTLNPGTGANLTYSGNLSGSGGVAKSGVGTQRLSGLNAFTGPLLVNGGNLTLDNSLPASAVTLNSGTLALLNGSSTSGTTLTINGGNLNNAKAASVAVALSSQTWAGSFTVANPTSTRALSVSGPVALAANVTVTVSVGTFNVTSAISGAQSLTKVGSGSLNLNAHNTYSGGTTLSAGTLNLIFADSLGSGPLTLNAGILNNSSGSALALASNPPQTWGGTITIPSTSAALDLGTGAVTLTGSQSVNVSGTTLTVGGVISGAGFSLTKTGPGALVLNGANTLSGNLNFTSGNLTLGNALAAQNAVFNHTSTGTLTLPATASTFGGLAGSQNITLAGGYALTLNPGAGISAIYSGNLSGASATVAVGGAGTQIFSGAQTYTGATTVTSGTLLVNGSLAAASAVTVGNGAILGGSGNVGNVSLALGGSLLPGNGGTGNLTLGSLAWNGTTDATPTLLTTLSNGGNTSTRAEILGALTKGAGNTFVFDFQGTGYYDGVTATTYTLMDFGSNVGFTVSDFSYVNLLGGLYGNFVLNAGTLQFSAIPEPPVGTLALGLAALGLVFARRKRAS